MGALVDQKNREHLHQNQERQRAQPPQSESQKNQPRLFTPQSISFFRKSLYSTFVQLTDLRDLGYLVVDGFLHPLEAWNGYFTRFKMVKFNPTTDIPDLSGKVILVTGGKSLRI